jgi:hypothetical protein
MDLAVTEGQIHDAAKLARESLRDTHLRVVPEDEQPSGFVNLLDEQNGKTREAFIKDLLRLAPLGRKLFTTLFAARPEYRERIADHLSAGHTIQIARASNTSLAFPWYLVYDIPIGMTPSEYVPCRILKDWPASASTDMLCVFAFEHQFNTICPFVFWGVRHTIEQPPSMRTGQSMPVQVSAQNDPPVVVAGVSRFQSLPPHLRRLRALSNTCKFEDVYTVADLRSRLGASIEFAYFFCHGKRGSNGGILSPILELDESQSFTPEDVISWSDGVWPRRCWQRTSPLVFINGCHTTELTPELLVNFVDAFMGAYASGVLGTEITIDATLAREAAEAVFDLLAAERVWESRCGR